MLYLVKRNRVYYFRTRVPKDIQQYFPCSEIKKSLNASTYKQANSLVKFFIAEAERIFILIRSNTLSHPQIDKLVEQYLNTRMATHQKRQDLFMNNRQDDTEYDLRKQYAIEDCDRIVKENKEFIAKNDSVKVMNMIADGILHEKGIAANPDSDEYKDFCKGLVRANITEWEVLKARYLGEEHPYDKEQRNKKKSNTIKEVMEDYKQRRGKSSKARSLAKLPEKFTKILHCFKYETGESDILLSEIDANITQKVAERLAQYPLYRNSRHPNKTLDEIYALKNVEYPSYTTVDEEIKLLSSIYCEAMKRFNGLDRNYAEDLSTVVLGKSKEKESDYRDVFRPDDIQELINGLLKIKKSSFHLNPHLFFIPLIGLYQGMRVNEICQLYVEDIVKVDAIWCINNNENQLGKSLKNLNSKRINPIHPDLIKIGLVSFIERQKKKGYSRLWEGGNKISCNFYEKQGNYSHYFDKWFNGTFKNTLKLSNPAKQSFHSLRHTFINWFYQNTDITKHAQAVTALSGHLDQNDVKAFGFDQESMAFVRYSKELNVKKQHDTLKLLKYGFDIAPLKISF